MTAGRRSVPALLGVLSIVIANRLWAALDWGTVLQPNEAALVTAGISASVIAVGMTVVDLVAVTLQWMDARLDPEEDVDWSRLCLLWVRTIRGRL